MRSGSCRHPATLTSLCREHRSRDKFLAAAGGLRMTMTPHVLVVDDDPEIRRLLARFLGDNGFRVSGAQDGSEMTKALGKGVVDLVILDVMLPGDNGIDLCRELRRSSALPVIMLTARGDDTDRIIGLEIGADDYLAKPFNPRELLARIRAVLRRSGGNGLLPAAAGTGRLFRFVGWILDLPRRELTSPSGLVVDLTSGEFDLLLVFLEHPQAVLSRERLVELLHGRCTDPLDRSIDVQVSRLRRKLEDDAQIRTPIKTVRGIGYVFAEPVERQ
jgi:two-component system OmpR family response regulator